MGYRYIVLVERDAWSDQEPITCEKAAILRSIGMRHCLTIGRAALFVSQETPVIQLSDESAVIGHLFSNDGSPVQKPQQVPALPGHQRLDHDLLEQFWGEYILIQASGEQDGGLQVLRDPSGAVPCVYALADGGGFFTSDISIATRLGVYHRQIDWDFIAHALAHPHLKARRTALAGITELLPGWSLALRDAHVTTQQQWCPWSFASVEHRHRDSHDAAAEVRSAVASVTKAWADLDRSILLELSGGLDSSIIAACLRESNADVTCATLVTPVPGTDERHYAASMAGHLKAPLVTEALDIELVLFDLAPPPSAVTPRLAMLQYAVDQAMAHAAATHGVSSIFSGGGGDTVFGYMSNAAPAADAFREHGIRFGLAAIRDLSELHQCTVWKAGRLTLRKLWRGARRTAPDHSFLIPSRCSSLADQHPWSLAPVGAYPGDRERIMSLAATQIFRDGAPRGIDYWLRLPLLSQPVMEACLKVPTWMCISGGENRAVARAAFADVLPSEILYRRSKGSFTHYCGAVYQRQKHRMRDFLVSGELQARGFLDVDALNAFFARNLGPRDASFMRIFDLCMIENWIRHQS